MPLIHIENAPNIPIKLRFALFALGFRPFFLSATVFAVISIGIWLILLTKGIDFFNPYVSNTWWHAHEMIFGFCSAVIAGFMLTAVQNWTGITGTRHKRLVVLFMVWLLPRIMLMNQDWVPFAIVVMLDSVFLFLVTYEVFIRVFQARQVHNVILCGVIGLLGCLNIAQYIAIAYGDYVLAFHLLDAVVMLITVLIVMVGTRVIAFFTEKATTWQRLPVLPWVFRLGIVGLFACTLSIVLEWDGVLRIASAFSSVMLFIHWNRMGWQKSFKNPMLWSLQLAFLCVPLALMFIAFNYPRVAALHLMTIGAIGGMILAMISRVSLGHTGRSIKALSMMPLAFGLIFVSSIIRILAHLGGNWYVILIMISGTVWLISFGIYLIRYTTILIYSRVDGKEG